MIYYIESKNIPQHNNVDTNVEYITVHNNTWCTILLSTLFVGMSVIWSMAIVI